MDKLFRDCIRPYRAAIVMIGIITLIEVVLQIVIINAVKPILSEGIHLSDTEKVAKTGALMLSLVLAYAAAAISISRISSVVSKKVAERLRAGIYDKVLSLRNVKDVGMSSSVLMTNLMSDVNNVQIFITELFRIGLYIPILSAAIIINAYLLEPFLSVILATAFVISMIIVIFASIKRKSERTKIQSLTDDTVESMKDLLSSIRTIRAFRRWEHDYDRFTKHNSEWGSFATKIAIKSNYLSSLFTLTIGLCITLFLGIAIANVENIDAKLSSLIIFIQLTTLFSTCSGIAPFFITVMPSVRASYDRIEKVIDSKSENTSSGACAERSDDEMIVRYPEIDLCIPRGKETTLIGRLSSGKSTVVKSILCLNEPHRDMVFFNGMDVSQMDPSDLRNRIAYAGDFALVFKGTLRENIDAWRGNTDEKIREVCRASLIDDSLLDMDIEEIAGELSLNDKRKVSIARALASDAEMYVFDDCFNGYDEKTQILLVNNIREFLKGKTVLFVVQNALCSKESDNIAFIDRRTIIAKGTHDELIQSCPMYAQMCYLGGVQ